LAILGLSLISHQQKSAKKHQPVSNGSIRFDFEAENKVPRRTNNCGKASANRR
jgi:hypothetical protein